MAGGWEKGKGWGGLAEEYLAGKEDTPDGPHPVSPDLNVAARAIFPPIMPKRPRPCKPWKCGKFVFPERWFVVGREVWRKPAAALWMRAIFTNVKEREESFRKGSASLLPKASSRHLSIIMVSKDLKTLLPPPSALPEIDRSKNSGGDFLFIYLMNKALYIALSLFLVGCVSSTAVVSVEIKEAMREAFENEDNYPPDRNLLGMTGHARTVEEGIRSSQLNIDQRRLRDLFYRQLSKCNDDVSLMKSSVERAALETGCSKALLTVLQTTMEGVDFDFFESRQFELNPKYRYSQLILDERKLYPLRPPLSVLTPLASQSDDALPSPN